MFTSKITTCHSFWLQRFPEETFSRFEAQPSSEKLGPDFLWHEFPLFQQAPPAGLPVFMMFLQTPSTSISRALAAENERVFRNRRLEGIRGSARTQAWRRRIAIHTHLTIDSCSIYTSEIQHYQTWCFGNCISAFKFWFILGITMQMSVPA